MINQEPLQVHQLLMQENLGTECPKWDVYKGIQCFVICEGAIHRLKPSTGHVTVPLMELGNNNLQDMAMAMVKATIMEREELVMEAASIKDAVMAGSRVLDGLDLTLSAILVREGMNVPVKLLDELKVRVAFHKDVEPDTVICFPGSAYLGVTVTKENKFGMCIYNPASVIPVRIKPLWS